MARIIHVPSTQPGIQTKKKKKKQFGILKLGRLGEGQVRESSFGERESIKQKGSE